jgi:signal transduction histidine kinase
MRADVDIMARLVTQLLDTARLESPETMDMHDIDLTEVVRVTSQAIWPLMVKDGRNFEVIGIERPVMAHGNFDSICRALRNLLENALKHTPKGSPITVSLTDRSIKIRDKGAGVAEADKERIFGKFSRPDRQRGNGAGLGLFIVSRIMQLHGGKVSVDNAPDGGAVFTLSFPAPPQV